MSHGVKTPVEKYRKIALDYCTYHHWLMWGKSGGGVSWTLEDYAESSRTHYFVISIPSPDELRRMKLRR